MTFVASFIQMWIIVRILLIILGSIIFIVGIANAIKIEQIAGYYEIINIFQNIIMFYFQCIMEEQDI